MSFRAKSRNGARLGAARRTGRREAEQAGASESISRYWLGLSSRVRNENELSTSVTLHSVLLGLSSCLLHTILSRRRSSRFSLSWSVIARSACEATHLHLPRCEHSKALWPLTIRRRSQPTWHSTLLTGTGTPRF